MGAVFLATHQDLNSKVAVKVLDIEQIPPAQREQRKARFLREAQLASQLRHPHVVRVFGFGEYEDIPYLIMDYVPGADLRELIEREAPVKPVRALEIAHQIALGLEALERHNIVHRDINPSNIRIENYAKGEKLKLTIVDLGLAKPTLQDDGMTCEGTIMGTPRYMAPEQINLSRAYAQPAPPRTEPLPGSVESRRRIDSRADMYSLGIILYELLTREPPFQAGEALAIALAHLEKVPPELPKSVPRPLRKLVKRLLQKNPDARYRTVGELLLALKRCEDDLVGHPRGSRPVLWPMACVVVAVLLVLSRSQRLRTDVPADAPLAPAAVLPIAASAVPAVPAVPEPTVAPAPPAPVEPSGPDVPPAPARPKRRCLEWQEQKARPYVHPQVQLPVPDFKEPKRVCVRWSTEEALSARGQPAAPSRQAPAPAASPRAGTDAPVREQ